MNEEPSTGATPPVTSDAAGPVDTTPPLPWYRRLHPAFRFVGFLLFLVAGVVAIQVVWNLLKLPHATSKGIEQPLPLLLTATMLVILSTSVNWLSVRVFEGRGLRTLGFGLAPGLLRRVGIGLFFGGLTPAIVAWSLAAVGIATITRATPDLLAVTLPMFLAMAFISSWEELVLRGYFMQAIGAMGGPWVASIVSGLLFGLVHAGNPGANPAGLIITALNGILLALMTARTGSLWLACGYHAGWNLVAALGFGMRDSGMVSPGALFSTDLKGPTLWTGGSYGFEASLLSFLVELVILVVLCVHAPRWAGDSEAWPYYQKKR